MIMNGRACANVTELQLNPPQHGLSAPSSLHDAKQVRPVHSIIGLGNAQDHRSSRELLCPRGRAQLQQVSRKYTVHHLSPSKKTSLLQPHAELECKPKASVEGLRVLVVGVQKGVQQEVPKARCQATFHSGTTLPNKQSPQAECGRQPWLRPNDPGRAPTPFLPPTRTLPDGHLSTALVAIWFRRPTRILSKAVSTAPTVT
jgi:hypothetical protein